MAKITDTALIDEFSRQAASEIFNLFDSIYNDRGKDFTEDLAMNFLARYIYVLTLNTLSDEIEDRRISVETAQKIIRKNFHKLQERMQFAIAMGFQKAVGTYEHKEVEYFCKLTKVSDNASKLPC